VRLPPRRAAASSVAQPPRAVQVSVSIEWSQREATRTRRWRQRHEQPAATRGFAGRGIVAGPGPRAHTSAPLTASVEVW